jgi:hypothetical protein
LKRLFRGVDEHLTIQKNNIALRGDGLTDATISALV